MISPLLSIPSPYRVPTAARLGAITGTAAFGGGDTVAILATVVIVVIVIAAFVLPPQRPTLLEWFAIVATALGAVAQLGPSYYFENYAAFMAPFMALLLAFALARLLAVRVPRIALVVAAVAVLIVFANSGEHDPHFEGGPTSLQLSTAVVPAGSCTLSDAPSKLVTTNRFVASDPATCNDMIDPEGATLAYGFGSSGAQQLWTVEVKHADYLVTSTPFANWDIPPKAPLASLRCRGLPSDPGRRTALLRAERVSRRVRRAAAGSGARQTSGRRPTSAAIRRRARDTTPPAAEGSHEQQPSQPAAWRTARSGLR